MNYIKPYLKSFSADGIIEELGPGHMQYTVHLYPTATPNNEINRSDLDGFVALNSDGGYSACTSGVADGTGYAIVVGSFDSAADSMFRGFIGFDISSIHTTVVSATLKIYQVFCNEGAYDNRGNLMVDHINFGSELNATEDYNISGTEIGAVSSNATLELKTLDVTQYVQDDLDNGRTASQFRLRFANETELDDSYAVSFNDTEQNAGTEYTKPELEITYY